MSIHATMWCTVEEARHQWPRVVEFHLKETEWGRVGGGSGMLSDCLKGKGFSLGVMKMFRN